MTRTDSQDYIASVSESIQLSTDRTTRDDPTSEDVHLALHTAMVSDPDDGRFVILSRGEEFVQCAGNILERGNGVRLWRAPDSYRAREVFDAFLARRRLPADVEWTDATHTLRTGGGWRFFFALLAIAILVAACWIWLASR